MIDAILNFLCCSGLYLTVRSKTQLQVFVLQVQCVCYEGCKKELQNGSYINSKQ